MAQDNVDIFEKIIFSIPSAKTLLLMVFVLGAVYSASVYGLFRLFTSFPLQPFMGVYLAVFVFILPTLISGELFHNVLPDYPRNWGYFLALSNQLILFFYAAILSGADNPVNAWHIIWLGLTTVFLSSFLVLLLTVGDEFMQRIALVSPVQPLVILGVLHYFIGPYIQVPMGLYLTNLGVVLFAGILLFLVFKTLEYLFSSNTDVSMLQLTSGLLQKRQEALDLGYLTKPDVQTLKIENRSGEAVIAVPWIHPGPLEGFGGGEVTTRVIEHLNRDGKGFFFHVPSTHKSDLADPNDGDKIIDALADPELHDKASKLFRKEYEDVVFYGRKINGKKLVFMDAEEYDDYEVPVFREAIDPSETIIVDLHDHPRDDGPREELWYNTEDALYLRECLSDFLDELDRQSKHEYHAGFESRLLEIPVYASVEQVDGQKVLMLGFEENGVSSEIKEQVEQYYGDSYDEIVFFSTDTHRSIHELSSDDTVDFDDVIDVVETAESEVSRARIGFENRKSAPVKLLQEDYSSLIFSINILVRLAPLTLILLYLALIIWVF